MKAWDARCLECDHVHIIWLPWTDSLDHDAGDVVGITHGSTQCGSSPDHELIASLDGISHSDKWGRDDSG